MSKRATASFEVTKWEEQPFNEIDGGPRLTRAKVTKSFRGDIEGEGNLEYLMIHRDDGSASFVGLERVIGRLGTSSGSFVLQHTGTFEGGTATATCTVVPGSGTGDLTSLRGEATFAAQGRQAPITLDYALD